MGVKAGVDPLTLFEAIRQGVIGRRRTYDALIDQFLPGVYDPPAFALRLAHKDVSLATALGREQPRQASGPVVQLWPRDEGGAPADANDLVVVVEDRQRLPDNNAAHAEAASKLRLGRQRVARLPEPGFDLLLEDFLKLIVQGDKAAPIELLNPERWLESGHLGEVYD